MCVFAVRGWAREMKQKAADSDSIYVSIYGWNTNVTGYKQLWTAGISKICRWLQEPKVQFFM